MDYPELLPSLTLLQSQLAAVVPRLAANTVALEELEQLKDTIDAVRSTLWITFVTDQRRSLGAEESLPRVLARARMRRAGSLLSELRQDVLDGRMRVDDPAFLDLHRALEQSMWSLIRMLGSGQLAQE